MPSPSSNGLRNALDRSLPTLSKMQCIVLWLVGIIMVLTSTGLLVFEVFKQTEITKTDLIIHGIFVGAGLLLMVPRRCLAVLEQLPKLKWFGNK